MGNNQSNSRNQVVKARTITDDNIKAAVRLWCKDPAQATVEYGLIEEWDTSNVTNMGGVFMTENCFDADIGGWDVSRVTNMGNMFRCATKFNKDLSGWDVSRVTNMAGMFRDATSFNQDLSKWDVSMVIDMACMFLSATSFNQDLSGWDVSRVTCMASNYERQATKPRSEVVPCDAIFDMEDIYRYICHFI